MVFFGEYQVSVTDGGRIVLPKKIRENLKGASFVLTTGFDTCLAGYDREDWEERTTALNAVSILDTQDIVKKRKIFSGAHEITIDEQGRLVVPKSLIGRLADWPKQLIVIGVGDHFELWEEGRWKEYVHTTEL